MEILVSWVMSTATSLATHRIPGRTVMISSRTTTCFVETVRNSGMIDRTFKPIVSIVGEAATRPTRIDARRTMISETYKSTVGRIEMGLLAQ